MVQETTGDKVHPAATATDRADAQIDGPPELAAIHQVDKAICVLPRRALASFLGHTNIHGLGQGFDYYGRCREANVLRPAAEWAASLDCGSLSSVDTSHVPRSQHSILDGLGDLNRYLKHVRSILRDALPAVGWRAVDPCQDMMTDQVFLPDEGDSRPRREVRCL